MHQEHGKCRTGVHHEQNHEQPFEQVQFGYGQHLVQSLVVLPQLFARTIASLTNEETGRSADGFHAQPSVQNGLTRVSHCLQVNERPFVQENVTLLAGRVVGPNAFQQGHGRDATDETVHLAVHFVGQQRTVESERDNRVQRGLAFIGVATYLMGVPITSLLMSTISKSM